MPVEADAVAGEAAAAAEKARAVLDEAARRGEAEGPEQGSLMFVGANPRWIARGLRSSEALNRRAAERAAAAELGGGVGAASAALF